MPTSRTLLNVRRISQAVFLLLFFWLLFATFYHGVVKDGEALLDTLPYPVSLFLYIDPLAAVSTFLSTWTLHQELLWSLVVIIPTLFLGRWFCGWACPFGTIHHIFSLGSSRRKRKQVERNRPGRHQSFKYVVLLFFLGSALAGTLLVGILDPLCFLIRSLGLSILPALDRVARGTIDLLPHEAATLSSALHRAMDQYFLGPDAHRFYAGWLIGALFLVVVGLNRYMPRFWCRALCPLGALLGVFSRFTLLGMHRNDEACNECTLCAHSCQGAASPEKQGKWKAAECMLCFNCSSACPQDALSFGWGVQTAVTDSKVDLSRRGFVASFAIGAAAYPLMRSADDPASDPNPAAIRPPGACAEEEFLARCIKCGQCMKVCPNNALHPAVAQAGVEGFWTPVLISRIGYCEPTCTLCSQVCPTGAIRKFTAEDKKANRVRLGTAFFDRGRCLPWAMAKDCMVCEEFCPTSPKAIWFEKRKVQGPDGTMSEINHPHVNPSLCTGCGVCENVCPVADRAAVRITSVGESRSKHNRILLKEDKRET
ncbi:MAG: 4Fe-4S binding protein [Planctomycetota bacterium]